MSVLSVWRVDEDVFTLFEKASVRSIALCFKILSNNEREHIRRPLRLKFMDLERELELNPPGFPSPFEDSR